MLRFSTRFVACMLGAWIALAAAAQDFDDVTLIHNAVIYTVDAERPVAEALAFMENGEILSVGDADILRKRFPSAQVRDLEGKTVIPGLIDAHGHLNGLALSLTRAQLAGTRSKGEIIERLKAHAAKLAEGDWLLGRGWDQNDWPEPLFPTREDLDAHFPDRPVWLTRIDGHAVWGNSQALAAADRDLSGDWQEEGGFIHRDEDGQPTGIFIDGARRYVQAAVPKESDQTMMAALDLALIEMTRFGLTGVHDPGVGLDVVRRYQKKIEQGRFHTRVYAMTEGIGDALEWLCRQGPLADPSGRLVMRATKLYADGALGSRGAALLAPYDDDPGNQGLMFSELEVMEKAVDRVMGCGLQAAIHAIGDRANRQALDALQAGMAKWPENPGRHRIEHVQVLAPADLPRLARLGVIASMQPTHATSDMYWAERRIGRERARYAYAWRSLADSGARLALGSDFPVEQINPMLGIHAAVTRQDTDGWPEGGWQAQERLTRQEALRGFTLDAAYAGFMENAVGSLEEGKQADFVVLDRDLMRVPEHEIADIRVLETWLGGFQVYSAP